MTDLASRTYGFYGTQPRQKPPAVRDIPELWVEIGRPAQKGLGPGDPRHGTDNGYNNHGCRCDECKVAWRARMRQQREARRSRPIPERVHGTVNGYNGWHCRCAECREAHRASYTPSPRRAQERAKTEAMYADYCGGMSVDEVAAKWGKSTGAVYSRFHSAGLKRRTSGRPAAMYVDYCTGLSVEQVAAKWGVSDKTVWAAFRRLKVPLRSQRGCVNRTGAPKGVPFEAQNAARAAEAGWRKAEAAKAALGRVVDPRQRQVLELRATHPDKSMAELAALCGPPMNKDMFSGLLRRALAVTA